MEDATDATGNFLPYMMAIQKQSALSRKSYPSSWAKPCERLRQAFDKADKALSEHFQKEGESNSDYGLSSGACACVALHEGLQLAVANLGDCRTLCCRGGALEVLTKDHKPDEPEAARLAKEGIPTSSDGHLAGGLSVSRASGVP